MLNLIQKVGISRCSTNGRWDVLEISVITNGRFKHFQTINETDINEDEALSNLMDNLMKKINSEHLKSKILEGFHQLQAIGLSGNSFKFIDIPIVDSHISCKMNLEEHNNPEGPGENEITQNNLKQKLVNFNKDSTIMKFFEENKCTVCLNSYKEILDENLHINISSCGHPLCCGCADKVLVSDKKCPRCRVNITAESFNLMKFNADVEVDYQDQNVFL